MSDAECREMAVFCILHPAFVIQAAFVIQVAFVSTLLGTNSTAARGMRAVMGVLLL
jgi:hypothetical protein